MDSLKIFTVSDKYIEGLYDSVDKHVFLSKGKHYIHSRKYVGVVFSIGKYLYYAPLSSPKETDYYLDNSGIKRIRRSIVPIIRMVDRDKEGNRMLLGTIKLNNMLPVPEKELCLYDVDNEPDVKYKTLLDKEIRYINRHKEEIIKKAGILYREKTSDKITKGGYLKSTLDFRALEAYCDSWS